MQKHWVWLATRSGIGVRGRAELLRRFGTAERIYAMDRAALQAEEQRLEYMIDYAKSDEYRVQYAREKLGLVLPDDIKFDITD